MAIPQEKFTSIKAEVIELVSVLFESFNLDLDVEAQLQAHNTALGEYINRMARIGMAADVLGYKGLHDVCVTFQNHLRELHQQQRILTAEEREQLEEWPMLVMGYLSDAGSGAASDDLVGHLQQIIPDGQISELEYADMRQMLRSDGQQLDELETTLAIDAEPTSDVLSDTDAQEFPDDFDTSADADLVVAETGDDELDDITYMQESSENIATSTEPVLETGDDELDDITYIQESSENIATSTEPVSETGGDELDEITLGTDSDTLAAVSEEIHDAVSELVTTIEEVNRDNQSSSELTAALDLCADRLEVVGLSIAATGLMGIMDIVMICQEGLRNLAVNPDPEQLQKISLMTDWADALANYLSDPEHPDNSISLIAAAQQLPWIELLDEAGADTLLTMLMPEQIELDSAVYDDVTTTTTDEAGDIEFSPEDTASEREISSTTEDDVKAPESSRSKFDWDYALSSSAGEMVQPEYGPVAEPQPEVQELQFDNIDKSPVILNESVRELISLLRTEIESVQSRLNTILTQAIETEHPEEMVQSLGEYAEEIDRFALATDSLGLQGLANVLGTLGDNLSWLIDKADFNAERGLLLAEWPSHILTYLNDINNRNAVQSLLNYMANPEWPLPITQDHANELQSQLLSPEIELEEEAEPRQQQASSQDVSLQLPEDVNQDLLDSLLRELPGYTAEFTEVVTRLTEGEGTQHDVDVAQRIAHTLKGAANTVGVVGIASLTHHIEDILQAFSKHGALPGSVLSDSLMQAADTLEIMSESLLGMGPPPDDAVSVLQQILDWANHIDEYGIPEDDAQAAPVSHHPGDEDTNADAAATSARSVDQEEQLSGDTILRVPAKLVDDLLRVVGESVILNGQLSERLHMARQQSRAAAEHNKLLQQLTFELEQLVDIQGLTWTQQRLQINHEFDALEMDQYNELHSVTRRLVEAATDSQEFAHNIEEQLVHLDELVIEQGRLHRANQETVMQTRMVPVQNIVPRLQRGVRQASRLTDKKVRLDVIGSNALMDSDVLNNLIDPLMHILRNAIDHGIESEPVRLAKGKATEGRISLTFIREGDQMLVRCRDDGAGLDYEAIRQTAIERGLLESDQEVSEEELRRFILQQGFSTRTQATQISGRGIGMDAVYNRIISLKGSLTIDSEPGNGTQVELRLPITFISVHGLLIRTRNRKIAFSSRGVEQILYVGTGVLNTDNDMLTYQLGDDVYDAVHIDHLLHLKSDRRKDLRHDCPVLLVREDTGSLRAILVEEVIGSQDLVVKGLGKYLPEIEGIEGATILGDGSVATVIDLPDLLRADSRRLQIESGELDDDLMVETPLPCALVVDDSLTARRTLAEFIQDMGYEVRTARDGLEAIDIIEGKQPDIVLADLEMPRMNGLELTTHIRAKQETRDIPIIMITSRSTEKHRQQAKSAGVDIYLTKPFSEDELMQHIEKLQMSTA